MKEMIMDSGAKPAGMSDGEWQARVELSAIYNLLVKYRMTDLTNQWHSIRVPNEDAFIIAPLWSVP